MTTYWYLRPQNGYLVLVDR